MSTPRLPKLSSVNDTWGPPTTVPAELRFNEVPYAPFSKGDKLGRVADWATDPKDQKDQKRQQYGKAKDPYHAYGSSTASYFTNEDEEDISTFSVVDNTSKSNNNNSNNSNGTNKPRSQNAVLRTRGGGAGASGRGGRYNNNAGGARQPFGQRTGGGGQFQNQNSGPPRYNNNNSRRGNWKDFDKPKDRNPSVAIAEEWELIQPIKFSELQKLSFDLVTEPEVISSHGFVHSYDRSYDKPLVNAPLKPLDRIVYNITTSEDPVLQKLASQNAGTIFATDSIISLLMCATKTVNPWDIIINKKNGKIFLDKREGGPLDFVSVDENAQEAPTDSADKDNINSSENLAYEATYVNQNFQSNVVEEANKFDLGEPNPFYSAEDQASGEPLLAQGYQYKKFNLTEDPESGEAVNLIIRTEVDGFQTVGNDAEHSFISIKALNEYGGSSGVLEWKNKFVNQRGAIVTAEMKNNLCKLSRWTVQALLAGASTMKIGFVSRVNPKDNTTHNIIGVLGRDPALFSSQLNIDINNGWGIVKSVINIANALSDGKYVLLKDPNNPIVQLYKVPDNTFETESSA